MLAVKTSVLKVGTVDVESAGPTNQIDTATGKAVLAAAQAYIDNAVFAPLKTGTLGAGYARAVRRGREGRRATGADEPRSPTSTSGRSRASPRRPRRCELSALDGTLGELMYVATDFDLTVKAHRPRRAVDDHTATSS